MSKKAYIGVGNIARKIKKMYVGVDGKARKVKKAYIGVNGVARLFFMGEPFVQKQISLVYPRSQLAGTTLGFDPSYVVFAGGLMPNLTSTAQAEAYNSALSRTNLELSVARYLLAATFIGGFYFDDAYFDGYAIFAGGLKEDNGKPFTRSEIDYFDARLTRHETSLGSGAARLRAATVGDYEDMKALFAGGNGAAESSGAGARYSDTVYQFDLNMTRSYLSLSSKRLEVAASSDSQYAVFAGGRNQYLANAVDYFDVNGTRHTASLSVSRSGLAGASIGFWKRLFAGGNSGGVCDCFDSNMTRSTLTGLSVERYDLAGAGRESQYAMFAGGVSGTVNNSVDTVEVYDAKTLTRTLAPALSAARSNLAGVDFNGKKLFAGGSLTGADSSNPSATVDCYEAQS